MLSVTLKDVLERNIPEEYAAGVYVWTNEIGRILYVGQSFSICDRFYGHMGMDHWQKLTEVGREALANMPLSFQWPISLYSIEDCKAFYPAAMLAMAIESPPHPSIIIQMAERYLISSLRPAMNSDHVIVAKDELCAGYVKIMDESSALHLAI